MTRDEADAKALELNKELGERGDDVSFYIAIETSPGTWQVEKQTEKKSWFKRILDALLTS